MPGRSSYKNRCDECKMYTPLCLCSEIPKIDLKTKIIVLMHHRELKLPTNTARLACKALTNSEIHIRGLKDNQLKIESLLPKKGTPLLLYPSKKSVVLTQDFVSTLPGPITLFVPDGSWKQASKVGHREDVLKNINHVKIPFTAPSQYRLRHSHNPLFHSTFEAISSAINVIEGSHIKEDLDLIFLKMVERVLWSRGELKIENCKTKIPEQAVLASHLAGMASR